MVQNTPAQRAKATIRYKLITDTIKKGLARLEADLAYGKALLKNSTTRDDAEARNIIKATTSDIAKTKRAVAIDQQENEAAVRRGEINKFW